MSDIFLSVIALSVSAMPEGLPLALTMALTIASKRMAKKNVIVKKLKQICNLYKVNVDEMTLNYLIETCGTNLQNLMNEIRKLIEHAGENGMITIQDVNDLAIKQIESIIFDLTDNLVDYVVEIAGGKKAKNEENLI